VISRQQRDVNRLPDPDLALSAVASKGGSDRMRFIRPASTRCNRSGTSVPHRGREADSGEASHLSALPCCFIAGNAKSVSVK
jgi:hypothetical protein